MFWWSNKKKAVQEPVTPTCDHVWAPITEATYYHQGYSYDTGLYTENSGTLCTTHCLKCMKVKQWCR